MIQNDLKVRTGRNAGETPTLSRMLLRSDINRRRSHSFSEPNWRAPDWRIAILLLTSVLGNRSSCQSLSLIKPSFRMSCSVIDGSNLAAKFAASPALGTIQTISMLQGDRLLSNGSPSLSSYSKLMDTEDIPASVEATQICSQRPTSTEFEFIVNRHNMEENERRNEMAKTRKPPCTKDKKMLPAQGCTMWNAKP